MIHLDTHVVVWLAAGQHDLIAPTLRERLATEDFAISPIVRLDLAYLHEVGRTTVGAAEIIDELVRATGLHIDQTPFERVVSIAERLDFTRDPFDRIIAAQSIAAGAQLATKDRVLLENLDNAIWS